MLVSLLRLAVFMHHAIKFVAGAFGHRVLQVAHLRFERAQLLEDFERRVHHRLFAGKIDVLGERSVAEAAQALDLAVVGRLGAHDQTQQCRLARAVAADQTDVFSGIDLESDAAQHLLRAVGFGHSCETEQHRMRNAEWGMRNAECGMRNDKIFNLDFDSRLNRNPHSAFRIPHSAFPTTSAPRRSGTGLRLRRLCSTPRRGAARRSCSGFRACAWTVSSRSWPHRARGPESPRQGPVSADPGYRPESLFS